MVPWWTTVSGLWLIPFPLWFKKTQKKHFSSLRPWYYSMVYFRSCNTYLTDSCHQNEKKLSLLTSNLPTLYSANSPDFKPIFGFLCFVFLSVFMIVVPWKLQGSYFGSSVSLAWVWCVPRLHAFLQGSQGHTWGDPDGSLTAIQCWSLGLQFIGFTQLIVSFLFLLWLVSWAAATAKLGGLAVAWVCSPGFMCPQYSDMRKSCHRGHCP